MVWMVAHEAQASVPIFPWVSARSVMACQKSGIVRFLTVKGVVQPPEVSFLGVQVEWQECCLCAAIVH
jgi:hypothetical protein